MRNKKGASQIWSRPNNEKNEHNEHAERTNEYKDNISHHGSINPAPSKITQFFRKFKANPFVQDLAKVAIAIAPVSAISKAKAVKNMGSAFGNASKQYLGKGTSTSVGKTGYPSGSYMDKFHSNTGLNKKFFDDVAKNTGATNRVDGVFPLITGTGGRITSSSIKKVGRN